VVGQRGWGKFHAWGKFYALLYFGEDDRNNLTWLSCSASGQIFHYYDCRSQFSSWISKEMLHFIEMWSPIWNSRGSRRGWLLFWEKCKHNRDTPIVVWLIPPRCLIPEKPDCSLHRWNPIMVAARRFGGIKYPSLRGLKKLERWSFLSKVFTNSSIYHWKPMSKW
jgi:hypothetical protein